ncbi:MAG: Integral membrane protein, partial [uncultured Blastococcus sp.]
GGGRRPRRRGAAADRGLRRRAARVVGRRRPPVDAAPERSPGPCLRSGAPAGRGRRGRRGLVGSAAGGHPPVAPRARRDLGGGRVVGLRAGPAARLARRGGRPARRHPRIARRRPTGRRRRGDAAGLHRPDPADLPGPLDHLRLRASAAAADVLRVPRPHRPRGTGRRWGRRRPHRLHGDRRGPGHPAPARGRAAGPRGRAVPGADPAGDLDRRVDRRHPDGGRGLGGRAAGRRGDHRPTRAPAGAERGRRTGPGHRHLPLLRPGAHGADRGRGARGGPDLATAAPRAAGVAGRRRRLRRSRLLVAGGRAAPRHPVLRGQGRDPAVLLLAVGKPGCGRLRARPRRRGRPGPRRRPRAPLASRAAGGPARGGGADRDPRRHDLGSVEVRGGAHLAALHALAGPPGRVPARPAPVAGRVGPLGAGGRNRLAHHLV